MNSTIKAIKNHDMIEYRNLANIIIKKFLFHFLYMHIIANDDDNDDDYVDDVMMMMMMMIMMMMMMMLMMIMIKMMIVAKSKWLVILLKLSFTPELILKFR